LPQVLDQTVVDVCSFALWKNTKNQMVLLSGKLMRRLVIFGVVGREGPLGPKPRITQFATSSLAPFRTTWRRLTLVWWYRELN